MTTNNISLGGDSYGPIAIGQGAMAVSNGDIYPSVAPRTDGRQQGEPRPYVFISYHRADRPLVDPVVTALRAARLDVRYDTEPVAGREVTGAISACSAFVACFSSRYADRARSSLNDELRLATAHQVRYSTDARWLVPILVEPCELPDLRIDSATSLTDLRHIDFSTAWGTAITELITALRPPT